MLKDGDPTGRESIISLGIFCESIIICSQAKGLRVDSVTFHDDKAEILYKTKLQDSTDINLVSLLKQRCSDRSIYQPTSISQELISQLQDTAVKTNVHVQVKTELSFIQTIAQLTSQGIRLALSSPSFRNELVACLVPVWSRKKRGISIASLFIPGWLSLIEPFLLRRGIGLDAEARLEKNRWLSASAVICITTDGDMPQYWFSAGRTYLRLSLCIEKAGLAQATSAALVEASNFHEDIESLLNTKQRLQCVLRIGKGSRKKRFSPRINTDEILTSNQ